ncbi:pyridoxamine 5'-phosphate oxidase family protein [Nonomuraea ferruginea]
MDLQTAREFLARNHRAVLLTRHADGRPQMSPVVVGVDAEGRIVVSSRETAVKTRNARRDPPRGHLRLHRRLLRPVDPGRGHRGDHLLARGHGPPGVLLP